MSDILGIPIPTLEQVIVGTELVFILYIPKRVVSKLDGAFRTERNKIIHRHVKTGHDSRLKQCTDFACASLRNPSAYLQGQQVFDLPVVVDTEL